MDGLGILLGLWLLGDAIKEAAQTLADAIYKQKVPR